MLNAPNYDQNYKEDNTLRHHTHKEDNTLRHHTLQYTHFSDKNMKKATQS